MSPKSFKQANGLLTTLSFFHETFHTTGTFDVYLGKANARDYSTTIVSGAFYRNILAPGGGSGVAEDIFIHKQHFIDITKRFLGMGLIKPGQDVNEIRTNTPGIMPSIPKNIFGYNRLSKAFEAKPNPRHQSKKDDK